MNIPLMDLWQANAEIFAKTFGDLDGLVRRSQFIGGESLKRFEEVFAAYTGSRYAAGMSNGTASLELALRALQVGPGDEVITVSHTFAATIEAIVLVGATPVLIDVDPSSGLMDLNLLEEKITKRTKALVPVHLYGSVVDLDRLVAFADKHRLALLQDAAQAHGALWRGRRLGEFSGLQSYSFYPGKNLGAWGDAGAITGNDTALVSLISALANHGRRPGEKYTHHYVGTNARMDPLQAVVLTHKLASLESKNVRRRELYALFKSELSGVGDVRFLTADAHCTAVHHLLVIKTDARDRLAKHLMANGIASGIHYPEPLHQQPALQKFCRFSALSQTEGLAREILSLPFFPEMNEAQIEHIMKTLKSFYK
jgi:dTDP-4-amino-4,6-dideoxygalactose transaminase